ncbi:ABC transporter substrate-binding protein [Hathewaya histolytica]|uniref:Putative ABC transporter substrate-binding protein n=1 Tax=Hathewaya histolytica TaxID=1498 RepID=A0A4U9RQR8_HATHI|nr:ABC transporter substrate-binding protein [Hathewaya histolytica]VTQ93173.1 putative ABC transporter substrate-binding protein [Hathewaya histolytica]
MSKKYFKRMLSSFLILILSISVTSCGNKNSSKNKLTEVKVNEVARSIFYAPMYVAINEGLFEKQGLKINLFTGQGADKTMQQVLSKGSDIGLCGPEQVIYIYNQKREDHPVIFSGLTQKDGSFLVGRKEDKNFKWDNLKGKKVIGGRPGGMPEMTFEYVLKQKGLTPGKDVDVITNIAFHATAGAFKSGNEDYATLFEPTASMLKKDNSGYVVASIGELAGNIPYTSFFGTKSYLEKNPKTIESFTRAIYQGQKWIYEHSDAEIIKSIQSFFPSADKEILVNSIKSYKQINAFAKDPVLKEEELNRLMDIIENYKKDLIKERPDFNKIVDNSFAEKVMKN